MNGPGPLATPGACPICGAGSGAPCDPAVPGPIEDRRHSVPEALMPFLLVYRGWTRYLEGVQADRLADPFTRGVLHCAGVLGETIAQATQRELDNGAGGQW